mmetsp:Transcript_49565/g.160176  ORF Transcript_49565/g.160176 Transcript_49565/m.160176 type:complete len:232 (+) Transcript_49565:5027-5722(+)
MPLAARRGQRRQCFGQAAAQGPSLASGSTRPLEDAAVDSQDVATTAEVAIPHPSLLASRPLPAAEVAGLGRTSDQPQVRKPSGPRGASGGPTRGRSHAGVGVHDANEAQSLRRNLDLNSTRGGATDAERYPKALRCEHVLCFDGVVTNPQPTEHRLAGVVGGALLLPIHSDLRARQPRRAACRDERHLDDWVREADELQDVARGLHVPDPGALLPGPRRAPAVTADAFDVV